MAGSTTYAELNGLRIGEGSDYPFRAEPAGLSTASEASSVARSGSHGVQWLGADRLVPVELTFDVQMSGTATTLLADRDALLAAWGPIDSDTIDLEVELDGTARLLKGRPRRCVVDHSDARFGVSRARCVFEGTDPRWYSTTLSTLVLGLTAGGGMTFPATFPLTFGVGGDSDGTATNAGTFETPWTAAITGPVTTPRITLGSTGEFVELDGTVPSGSTLTLDSEAGSVLLDGSPRQSWQSLLSRWFVLPSGANTIRFRAASGSGSLTFSWRSAWL